MPVSGVLAASRGQTTATVCVSTWQNSLFCVHVADQLLTRGVLVHAHLTYFYQTHYTQHAHMLALFWLKPAKG